MTMAPMTTLAGHARAPGYLTQAGPSAPGEGCCRFLREGSKPNGPRRPGGSVHESPFRRSQFDIRGTEVLLQPIQLRGTGNRNDPRLLRQQPRDRDLRGSGFLLFRDMAEQV